MIKGPFWSICPVSSFPKVAPYCLSGLFKPSLSSVGPVYSERMTNMAQTMYY